MLAQKHTISGYVSDFETGESVIGANIFSNDYSAGVSSNKYGFYSITLDEGTHTISFKFIGYETITKEFNLNKDIEFNAEFKLSSIVTDEVTVTGKANVVQRTETSVIEIPIDKRGLMQVNWAGQWEDRDGNFDFIHYPYWVLKKFRESEYDNYVLAEVKKLAYSDPSLQGVKNLKALMKA